MNSTPLAARASRHRQLPHTSVDVGARPGPDLGAWAQLDEGRSWRDGPSEAAPATGAGWPSVDGMLKCSTTYTTVSKGLNNPCDMARYLASACPASLAGEMVRVVVVSFRLGGADGVSTEAAKWEGAFKRLGCSVLTLAGEGRADLLDPGLAVGSYVSGERAPAPDRELVYSALSGADLAVIENLCSLPLNPLASAVVADPRWASCHPSPP